MHWRNLSLEDEEYVFQRQLNPANNYISKVNNRNPAAKWKIKTLEQRHGRHSGVFIVNFEHTSNLVLIFLLVTLNNWMGNLYFHIPHFDKAAVLMVTISSRSDILRMKVKFISCQSTCNINITPLIYKIF